MGLRVSFSALNPVDSGFGVGWSLATTRYDTRRRRLSLSTGESFMVDEFIDGNATFKDRKLRSFDLFQLGAEDFLVVHKSGMLERLRVILVSKASKGSDGVALLCEVSSPEGHVVAFEQTAINGIARLHRVSDGTDRVLLEVAYEIDATVVTLHPNTAQAGAFTFTFKNDWLDTLSVPEGYGDGWAFGYEPTETGLLLLKSTTAPTGGYEEVTYKLEGHALPGGPERPLSHMPVVLECRRDPGHQQPVMTTHYTYSDRNFFGFGVLQDWHDDEDNLYRVVMPPGRSYEYSSIETLYDGIETVRTVERTFNRFHLITSERSTQSGCVTETRTKYDENPEQSFVDQPAWCQLPTEVQTLYYLEGSPERVRKDVEVRTYDATGNVLTHTDVQGAVEHRSYYPARGIEGECPADPLGFIRFLREKRVSPAPESQGAARVVRCRYEILPSRLPGGTPHVVPSFEENFEENSDGAIEPLGDVTYAFVDDFGPHHGRPLGTMFTLNGVSSVAAFVYSLPDEEKRVVRRDRLDERPATMQRDASDLVHPTLVTAKTTRSANDDETIDLTSYSARSLVSGQRVMDQGRNGVVMRHAHDLLGRTVAKIAAADSDFAAMEKTSYVLSWDTSYRLDIDASEQTTRSELDGFGREVRRVAVDWDGDGKEHEVWRATYDVLGRIQTQTTTDIGVPLAQNGRMVSAKASLSLTTSYRYDGWGNMSEETRPDGVTVHNRTDPVERTDETWEAAPSSTGLVTRTVRSVTGKPLSVARIHGDGAILSAMDYEYDGYDRCLVETSSGEDVVTRSTRHRYDAHDRLIESILPDGAVVSRTYPAYTTEGLVTSIAVRHESLGADDICLGEQAFDGLGRRYLFRAGRRDTIYRYDSPISCEPDHIDLPSGQTLMCHYEKHLADELIRLVSSEETVVLERDVVGGRVTLAENDLGSVSTSYFPSGKVKSQSTLLAGVSRATDYTYSLLGKEVGSTASDGGFRVLGYDLSGRLAMLDVGEMKFVFDYDEFSRAKRVHSETRDGARAMDILLGYDDLGREVERHITARIGKRTIARSLLQSYTADDRLSSRTFGGEGEERDERYTYDVRGRMTSYACEGTPPPESTEGLPIRRQDFSFDALDNVRQATTWYADLDEPEEIAWFGYDALDPTQLVEWLRQKEGSPDRRILFAHDESGNLREDEEGRELTYDAMGRLCAWVRGAESCVYHYDPMDRLGSISDTVDLRHRYYDKDKLAYERRQEDSSVFHASGRRVLAETRLSKKERTAILLGADAQGSTVCELSDEVRIPVYTPYGKVSARAGKSDIAYAGEVKDRSTGWYLLDSYRAYNPVLMCFHSPDSASPFGRGGLNGYVYALSDPVNHIDPTGQSVFAWLLAGVGAAVTIALTVASWGTLSPALGAVGSMIWGGVTSLNSVGASTVAVATSAGAAAASTAVSSTVAAATLVQWGHSLVAVGGGVSVFLEFGAAWAESEGDEELAGALGFFGGALGFLADAGAIKPAAKALGRFLYGNGSRSVAKVAAETAGQAEELQAFRLKVLEVLASPRAANSSGELAAELPRRASWPLSKANSTRVVDPVSTANKKVRSASPSQSAFGDSNSRSPSALSHIDTMNRAGFPGERSPSPYFSTPVGSPMPERVRVEANGSVTHFRRFS